MRTISLHSTSFSLLEFHGTKNLAHSRINGSVSLIPMARSQFQPKKRRDIGTSNRNPSFSWMATVGEKVQNSTVPTSVPVRVALELLQAGHRYLDVRTAEEFSDGHASGAINIPYMLRIGSGEESVKVACCLGSCASPMRCATARAWRTPPIQVQFIVLLGFALSLLQSLLYIDNFIGNSHLCIFDTGMIKNSNFLEEVLEHFGKDDEIIVGCQLGKRSFMAATELLAAGFTGVTDIAGGYAAWTESGLPIES
ncbi:hypothetical protein H5410_008472 [Solanum commersonii]|uniref:Rhodanese domain-containing protein n=1 Tax=Solanum commersonii TaxID=4109 RepID=A0A9J6AF05_SOLCO|nr:hypothetical protein H5410_008472 [Solanum commersonii]